MKFPNRNIEYMSENKIVASVFFQKEREYPHVQTIESHFSPPNGVYHSWTPCFLFHYNRPGSSPYCTTAFVLCESNTTLDIFVWHNLWKYGIYGKFATVAVIYDG